MKVSIIAPESITVGHYIDYHSDLSPIKQASVATGLTAGEVRAMPYAVIDVVRSEFEKAMDSIEAQFEPVIQIDGRKFGLHPNIDRMSTGEFLDLQQCEKNWIPNIAKALSVLYRPVEMWYGKKYKIEDYRADHFDNHDLMRTLPLSTASGALLFFSSLRSDLTLSLERMEAKELRKVVTELREDLQASGVGFTS